MTSASLVIKEQAGGKETQIAATFDDRETETLNAYYQYVEELSEAKLLKDGFPTRLQIQYEARKGTVFSTQLPPDDDVCVLLHKLRPLILNDEHASYNQVTGIIGRRFPDANIRSFLKRTRELYDGRHSQKQFRISTGNSVINSEQVLFDWLNATQYHRAQDKKKVIEALDAMLPAQATRSIFLMLLSDQASSIFDIAHFVGMLVGKAEAMEWPVDGPAKSLFVQAIRP